MRKRTFLLFFLILLNISNYMVFAYGSTNKEPDVKALGAVLIDFDSGRILWGKNINKPLAMASTTKIMTAILALEKGNLDDTVVVSKRAAIAPKVKMELKEGEKIKLEYLMYALMMQSSNDAAVAIAEHICGSVEEFCAEMTKKANEIGAKDTVFITPNGLDSGDHHSTAYDMALIARYALNNDEFVKIINTREISFKSSVKSYSVINKNRLLSEYKGADGVKTGFTGKAGHCFVGSVKRDNLRLISVVLGSGWGTSGKEQKWKDTKKILDYGFDNFEYRTILNEGDEIGNIEVKRAKEKSVDICYGQSMTVCMKKGDNNPEIVKKVQDFVLAPAEEGMKVGKAEAFIGNEKVGEVDIILKSSIERHDFKSSVDKLFRNWLEAL